MNVFVTIIIGVFVNGAEGKFYLFIYLFIYNIFFIIYLLHIIATKTINVLCVLNDTLLDNIYYYQLIITIIIIIIVII